MRRWSAWWRCPRRPAVLLALVLWLCSVSCGQGATATAAKHVIHPAFENAGKKEGLEIWRIENFEPVPYPEEDYGKFYSGDSYIVLFTKEDKIRKGTFSWDIHYWLGKETSQDEAGSAAILSVNLDDSLGGVATQHREVEGQESQQFRRYFKSGIKYVPGGVKSGFHHVKINAPGEKALYKVKGKKNVRVRQVEPKVTSMNKGDCFILDTGKDIYVYVGATANYLEKIKANRFAELIRDQDHAGRGNVKNIDASSTDEEIKEFFQQLGGGSASQIADERKTQDDQQFERNQDVGVLKVPAPGPVPRQPRADDASLATVAQCCTNVSNYQLALDTAALYKISDASGHISSVKIAEKPLQQDLLDSNDVFILDTATSGIYIWVGKKAKLEEKVEALKTGRTLLTKNPAWTKITQVVEGAEPAGFREYFSSENPWTSA